MQTLDSQPSSEAAVRRMLDEAAAAAAACTRCTLHANRTRSVFGCGRANAELMWIGEAPGPEEDASGTPFDGKSGELLHRIVRAVGRQPEDVWLTNAVNCRLDEARHLNRTQVEACRPHLQAQIDAVDPRVIIALGSVAWRWFQKSDKRKMRDVRGHVYRWGERWIVPTYHPAFLMRKPQHKRDVWDDVRTAVRLIDRPETVDTSGCIDITIAHQAERALSNERLF